METAVLTRRHADALLSWADWTDAAAGVELRGRPSPVTELSARLRDLGRRLSRYLSGQDAGLSPADLEIVEQIAPLAERATAAPAYRDPGQVRLAEDVLAIRDFPRRKIDG